MNPTIAMPSNMFTVASSKCGNVAPPISNELIKEVEAQLLRSFMTKCGGKLNLADAVALYGNSVDGARLVNAVRTNKDGSTNKNEYNFGNEFEALECHATQRNGIVDGDNKKAARTDDLSVQKSKGTLEHDSLEEHATLYDQHTDVVVYSEKGKVLERLQMKHVRGTAILIKENYTTHPDAPDFIVVPPDSYERHKENLEKISKSARSSEIRERAKIALSKLKAGSVDSCWTSRPDTDNHSILSSLVEKTGGTNGIVGKVLPHASIMIQAGSDAANRVGGRVGAVLLSELAGLVVGGAIWELRDAHANPEGMEITDRIKRLFTISVDKLKKSGVLRCGREISLEVMNLLLGLLSSVCASLKGLLQLLGKGLRQVWDSICDYISGKIPSFTTLVSTVAKVLSAVGIGTLALLLEEKLTLLGLPSLISGLLAAALAGVAIVFANRGIDALVFSLTSAFSQAKAAKLRYEKIAAYCEEIIPKLIESRENFEKMVNAYYAEREAIITKSFASLKATMLTQDVVQIFHSLEEINNLFGKSLGWSTQEEFDALVLSEKSFVL
ncbi:hypothetical protein [Desulfovibrio intestinalis]|uniref:Uncharacterized protein n=1 Tax=Desulfovibrio intestinalis TaxID=58621 RepID=A0A7W8C4T3_9BACT|nr:hypothetical protein [Desulfovibrio intestinalis]MBB5144329.1 hypothetical protein [Desulfovibrio intestinalis]